MSLILVLLTLISSCSGLFYQPTPFLYAHPKAKGTAYEDVWFSQGDGFKLHAWHLKRDIKKFPRSKGLILHFHGNAQNLSSHFLQLNWMTHHGYDVFIFDYRGYGLSEGTPHQAGVNKDALAALDFSLDLAQKGKHPKFIVYAQSLGGTIAMRAVQEWKQKEKIDLFVLDSTFMNYQGQVRNIMKKTFILWPFYPLSWVAFSNEFSPEEGMHLLQMPVLVIHGKRDWVVSYENAGAIMDKLTTPKKWFWSIDDGLHIDVFHRHGKRYRQKFLTFLKEEI